MNLSSLPELLLVWFKNQGAALFQADRPGQAATFKPGVQYEGKVLDRLPNGRHLVQLAGQKMDMSLPDSTQPGDKVRLTYLSGGVRPTFLLNQPASATSVTPAQPVSLSSTAQQVNALMRITTPGSAPLPQTSSMALDRGRAATPSASSGQTGAGSGQPSTSLTETSTLTRGVEKSPLGSPVPALAGGNRPIAANVVMLQSHLAMTQFTPGATVSPNTALVGQAVDGLRAAVPSSTTLTPNVLTELPEPSRNLLPTRLFQTLSESGLFYESHLARWVKGEISFESILREPQARISGEALPNTMIRELGGMPDEAARLAGRQLQLLEGAPFLWQGLAWPGQWMEWLVEERQEGGETEGEGEFSARWVTEIRLDLPRLGAIHARLAVNGDRIGVRLSSGDGRVRGAMLAALPELSKGLVAAGLRPFSLSVESPHEA